MFPSLSSSELNQESLDAWGANAAFWDDYMGDDGNSFYRDLELPSLDRLVSLQPGERALDLATGNGLVTRWLADQGGIVTATDAVPELLKLAQERAAEKGQLHTIYRLLDVTKDADFQNLLSESQQHGGFDVVTMNMAIMDIPTVEPLAFALPKLLKRNGRFVATILHPLMMGSTRHIEVGENQETGRLETTHSATIRRYLDIPVVKGVAIPGQPKSQPYFNRPFGELFGPFFRAGLVLDGLEEPGYPKEAANPQKVQGWVNFAQIPMVLAFRLRKAS